MASQWFLNLPPLPQTLIVNYLRLSDVLKLSTCSIKTKSIVKSAVIQPAVFHWKIEESTQNIDLLNARDFIYFRVAPDDAITSSLKRIVMNGVELRTCDKWYQSYWFLENYEDFSRISDHLLDVLSPENFDLFLGVRVPIWDHIRKTRCLTLRGGMSSEDVKFILEDVETHDLDLDVKVHPEGWKYSERLKAKGKLTLSNASWLHIDAILNSTASELIFYEPAPNLNTILKHWISGGMDELRQWRLIGYSVLEDVLDGIEFSFWDSTRIIRCNGEEYEVERGREIVQSNGKKRAVFVADNERSFRFYVFFG